MMTLIASSRGIDGYKLMTLCDIYDSWVIGSEGYISKYSLSVNFFSFVDLHKSFWTLLVYFCYKFSFPQLFLSFLIASPFDETTNPDPLSNG